LLANIYLHHGYDLWGQQWQRLGAELVSRADFLDDMVLIIRREQRRDLPLAECIIQRVVDRLNADTQPTGAWSTSCPSRNRCRHRITTESMGSSPLC
jgi:hypothetical protein